MIELIQRYAPQQSEPRPHPRSTEEAQARLVEGNREFMQFWNQPFDPGTPRQDVVPFDPRAWGLTESGATEMPPHEPFVAALSCSDARVPTELVFRQTFNDLFIVRLAGNVISTEGVGSLAFAATALHDSIKVVVVLGHQGCGAVTASVDAYLDPTKYPEITPAIGLRSVVDHILIAVRVAAQSLDRALGASGRRDLEAGAYRERLIHVATAVNAAHSAMTLQQLLADVLPVDRCVLFGIYDLTRHVVWSPDAQAEPSTWREPALCRPPASFQELESLSDKVAASAV
jgi:carbonic anhydrase